MVIAFADHPWGGRMQPADHPARLGELLGDLASYYALDDAGSSDAASAEPSGLGVRTLPQGTSRGEPLAGLPLPEHLTALPG